MVRPIARRTVRRTVRVGAPLASVAMVSGASHVVRRRSPATSARRRRIHELAPYASIDSHPAHAARSGDLPDELKRLADLKAAGALTDAEFAAAKAHLLTR